MDSITIERLALDLRIGAGEEERAAPQRLYATVSLAADLSRPCQTDSLEDTIDYAALADAVRAEAARQAPFRLVERLAEVVAQRCLAFDRRVESVSVRIEKPAALAPGADAAVVSICRPRQ